MLRTGQMILCQAIKRHVLYESFSLEAMPNAFMRRKYLDILRLFAENCSDERQSPFGIHSICQEGRALGLVPGQWYGPQMISITLRNICNRLEPVQGFGIHVCLDSNIFLDEIRRQIVQKRKALFVLIPTRLGLDSIQQAYLDQVKYHFQIS